MMHSFEAALLLNKVRMQDFPAGYLDDRALIKLISENDDSDERQLCDILSSLQFTQYLEKVSVLRLADACVASCLKMQTQRLAESPTDVLVDMLADLRSTYKAFYVDCYQHVQKRETKPDWIGTFDL